MAGVEQKKAEKRQALLDAAYALFLERGTAKTSVSDITLRARVAKGTFYLYFKDKDAVMRALLGRISYRLLEEAYAHAENAGTADFTERTILLVDYIIEYFRRERLVLQLMERNFILPTRTEFFAAAENQPLLKTIRQTMQQSGRLTDRNEEDIYRRVSVILGMCTSVCYSAIIENRPDTMDNMKPVLYDIIRRVL